MGLSVDDFLGLDTDEFSAAARAFGEHEEELERERWERMRLLGVMTLQPWSKGKLTAEKLLPLPWDKKPRDRKPLHSNGLRNRADDTMDGTRNRADDTMDGAWNRADDTMDGARNDEEQEERRLTKAEHRARAEKMLELLGETY